MNLRQALRETDFDELLERPETRLGAAVLVIVVGVWIFGEIADEVLEGDALAFDKPIMTFFREGPGYADLVGPEWIETVARELTVLGSYTFVVLLVFFVVGYLFMAKHIRHAIEVILASAGGAAMAMLLKMVYDRPRPDIVPKLTAVETMSFPSGHSTTAAVVYLTLGILLARFTRRRLLTLYVVFCALVLTFIVGWTRVALGVHYPTDVLAGWTLGLVWSLFSWLVVNFWENWKSRPILAQREAEAESEIEADKPHPPRQLPEEQPS